MNCWPTPGKKNVNRKRFCYDCPIPSLRLLFWPTFPSWHFFTIVFFTKKKTSQLKWFNQQQFSGLPSSLSKWSLVWDWAQIEIWKFNKNLIKALMIVCYIRDLCFKTWSILVRPGSTGQEEGIKIQTVRSNDHYDKKNCAKSCPKYQSIPLDS